MARTVAGVPARGRIYLKRRSTMPVVSQTQLNSNAYSSPDAICSTQCVAISAVALCGVVLQS
ncbi:MAG: hypothetical protein Q8K82_12830, partial [Gemmatimonadaceae bacterium]|nr:hypothetical protein [Gemmatimonadaceae bacterium]